MDLILVWCAIALGVTSVALLVTANRRRRPTVIARRTRRPGTPWELEIIDYTMTYEEALKHRDRLAASLALDPEDIDVRWRE